MNETPQRHASDNAHSLHYSDDQRGPLSSAQVRELCLVGAICIGLFAMALNLGAQEAKPKKGIGSVITFTNKKGEEIKDATVKGVSLDGIIWTATHPDGRPFGGRVSFADLPKGLASEFGYDPKKVAEINAKNAKATAEQNRLAMERRVEMDRFNQASLTKMTIVGTVTQVTPDGVLVTAEFQRGKQTSTMVSPSGRQAKPYTVVRTEAPTEDGSPLFVGRCFITDGSTAGWTDDQKIRATVYPNGTYTYVAVSGARLTINKFTLNPAKVTTPTTPEKFQSLKDTYMFNTPVERNF